MVARSRSRPFGRSTPSILAGGGVRRGRRWPWILAGLVAATAAALAFSFFAWPRGTVTVGAKGLPRVLPPSFGGRLERVSVRTADGTAVPVARRRDGTLRPRLRVVPGTRLRVEAVFRRPGWVGWIAGETQTVRLEVTAPRARLRARWLRVAPSAPVRVRFDRPVRKIAVTGSGGRRVLHLRRAARSVSLGRLGAAGSIGVSAVARTWERLPPATSVTWFPPGRKPMLLAFPKPGRRLDPDTPLRLRFSEPVGRLLHGRMPALQPHVAGGWRKIDAHTLLFTPHGYGFGLDATVRLKLPVPVARAGTGGRTRTIGWTTREGSELRLQQLLAQLGYLPLRWNAAGSLPRRTVRDQLEAAVGPPEGSFEWRYPDTPASLVRLWHEGRDTVVVRGAIMAFEDDHHLTVDGYAGRRVWRALIADAVAGKRREGGYGYVYVHIDVPQSLNLWHDGKTILSSPGNTGVPAAPTELGTFPVFEHIPIGTMSGTNPDGSHYDDPGVRYISYFNGGEAIHAFDRASYGTPQSLGCVELPLAAAARVWPYTPIGTLVTVEH